MTKIVQGTIILILAIIGIAFSNEVFNKPSRVVEVEEVEPVSKKVKRRPAAANSLIIKATVPSLRLDVTATDKRDIPQRRSDLYEDTNQTNPSSGHSQRSYSGSPAYYSGRQKRNASKIPQPSKASEKNDSSETVSDIDEATAPSILFSNVNQDSSTSVADDEPTFSDDFVGSTIEDELNCSPSLGGGAFGNPIELSISCSANAEIKYCVQKDYCCDPEFEGITYTTPIVLGANSGDYCLSFIGKTSSLKSSTITQQTYSFNNTYPDMQLNFPKINYQTTQLAGYNHLYSTDFGKDNFWIGQLNLKSHDPGPSGLNMNCEEIIEGHADLSSPTPTVIFDPIHLIGLTLGNQLNAPLVLEKLAYGQNFLTSYVVNNSYAAPLYSCSTNLITLNDFEYFAPEISHGDVGTNEVREFSGSFVSYSFFEEETSLYRTPAGSANEDDNGQELRVGSFGIFY